MAVAPYLGDTTTVNLTSCDMRAPSLKSLIRMVWSILPVESLGVLSILFIYFAVCGGTVNRVLRSHLSSVIKTNHLVCSSHNRNHNHHFLYLGKMNLLSVFLE